MTPIALIVVDLERSALGGPGVAGESLAGRPVLWHTVERAKRIPGIGRVVIVHPRGQDVAALVDSVDTFAVDTLDDPAFRRWRIARRWASHTWRGGLGGATVFDECLPHAPLIAALDQYEASSAVLLRGEWCLVDPALCGRALALHVEYPDAMKACFTQAPPGLCGIATSRAVLAQLAGHRATFAHVLGYIPTAPVMDPVGKDVNIPIPPEVRDTYCRLIPDTARGRALVARIAAKLGDGLLTADAQTVTRAARRIGDAPGLPEHVTIELTPRRAVAGPITPQHYVNFERPDLDPDLAQRLFDQLPPDACVMLGGLGDPLLHPQWDAIVERANRPVGIETDLLCDEATIARLLELPVELVVVRLNADRAETYRAVMGEDRFKQALENVQLLFNRRAHAVPWIVPKLVKTAETFGDLEGFFDKWVHFAGHAIIEGPRCGCGLMPDLGVAPMTPPDRGPCRQLGKRMNIHSDGVVAQCDQDWLGRGALGDAKIALLEDIWTRAHDAAAAHRDGRFAELTLCGSCGEWHRP